MKKLIILVAVSVVLILIGAISIVLDLVGCLNTKYPYPMLGIDAYSWLDKFKVDMVFFAITYGWVMLIALIVLIICIVRLKRLKEANMK